VRRIQPFPLAALAAALCACAGSDEDLTDVRAEVADLRAEQRAMRQEIRELRESLPKSTAAQEEAAPAAAPDEVPAEPPAAAAAPVPAGSKDPKPAPSASAGKTGAPPAQGSVNIQVESNPAGAAVYLADKKVGETPVMLRTPVGSSEISMRLEKKGYRPRLMTLRPEEDTKISVQLAKKSE
jgi:hypothetical protein